MLCFLTVIVLLRVKFDGESEKMVAEAWAGLEKAEKTILGSEYAGRGYFRY